MNKLWRIFATGFCFFTFGFGGILFGLVIFPLISLFCWNNRKKQIVIRSVIQYLFRFFIYLMTLLGIMKLSIEGIEKLVNCRSKIIIANHPSLIDVVVLIAYTNNVNCIVKSHLLKNPFMKRVIISAGYISNSRPEQLLADCKSSLGLGENLIIFPEGTRTTPNESLKFQRGAANIALRCGYDFLPVSITVSPSTLTKSEKWYQVPEQRFVVAVEVDKVFSIDSYYKSCLTKDVRLLTQTIENYFNKRQIKV